MMEPRLEVLTRSPEQKSERLAELEGVILRGKEVFLEVGRALDEIRTQDYYKPEYPDFDAYCKDKWGWSRRNANRYISWARADEKLAPIGIVPKNEAQARQIGRLGEDPEAAREVWDEVGKANGGKHPSEALKDAVDRKLRRRIEVPERLEPDEGKKVVDRYGKLKEELGDDLQPKHVDAAGKSARRAKRAREAEETRRRQQPTTETGEGDVHIYNLRMEDLDDLVPDGKVDLVLTDPPYHTDTKTMELWDELGKLARRVLKPDGLLVSYAGNYAIPEAIRRVEKNVPWWWQMIVLYTATDAAHDRGFLLDYKPIEVYRQYEGKPEERLKGKQRKSVMSGGKADKAHHKWGQPLVEAVHLILSFTEPGELVCDPFSGGGTIAVAAKMTGRKCVAAEKDAADHAASVERLKAEPNFVPKEIADALASAHPGAIPTAASVPPGTSPATVSALFGRRKAEPAARTAGTQEARIEGVRDALEGVSGEVVVLRPRDIAESSRKLRRRRFTR